MAARPIKDDNILGYLQRRTFSDCPRVEPRRLRVDDELIIEYANKSVAVTRMDGLFKPMFESDGLTEYEKLLIHAMAFVAGMLTANPGLNQSVTIIDGTNWEDSVQSEKFELAVEFVVLIYSKGKYTAIVSLDQMKRMKKATHYFLRNKFFKRKLFLIEFDPTATTRQILKNISASIQHTVERGAPYLFYTNLIKNELCKIYDTDNEYPVNAAFLVDDVIWSVPRPGRHHHILHSYEYGVFQDNAKNKKSYPGFLTNHGNFVSRKRAMFLAMRNHQIKGMGSFKMDYVTLAEVPHEIPEQRQGGLFNPKYDPHNQFYSICEVGLFSEDVW